MGRQFCQPLPCPAAAHVHPENTITASRESLSHAAHVSALMATRQSVNQQHAGGRLVVVRLWPIFVEHQAITVVQEHLMLLGPISWSSCRPMDPQDRLNMAIGQHGMGRKTPMLPSVLHIDAYIRARSVVLESHDPTKLAALSLVELLLAEPACPVGSVRQAHLTSLG